MVIRYYIMKVSEKLKNYYKYLGYLYIENFINK